MNLFQEVPPEYFYVRAYPKAKKEALRVEISLKEGFGGAWPGYQGPCILKVWLKAPAQDNKANIALIQALSCHFNQPKSAFSIVRGHTSREKLVKFSSCS